MWKNLIAPREKAIMTEATKRLENEIAQLPEEEKYQLLRFLISCLEEASPDTEPAWDEELARRADEILRGQTRHSIESRWVHPTSGREIFLTEFALVPTYGGYLEGTRERISNHVRAELPNRVAETMSPGKPLVAFVPETPILPDWLCIARLESSRPVSVPDPDLNSRLVASWFVHDATVSIYDMVGSLLAFIDWDSTAEDYDITMM